MNESCDNDIDKVNSFMDQYGRNGNYETFIERSLYRIKKKSLNGLGGVPRLETKRCDLHVSS
jgi:hypothetical protein